MMRGMSNAERWTPARGVEELLARYGTERAKELLTTLLRRIEPAVAITAPYADVLVLIGDGHGEAVLARWRAEPAASGLEHWPRAWAARAFAYVGDPGAGAALAEALEDHHWWVRKTAAQTLGRLRVTAHEAGLVRALRDPHVRVRRVAAVALGRVGTVASLEALQRALDDVDDDVRAAADSALSAITARGGR